MSAVAPTLQAFFTERLVRQRQASPHTVAAYRDALAHGRKLYEQPAFEALRRNREDTRDRGRVLGMAKGGEAKQRADRGEPRIARANAVPVIVFAMIEERADQRGVELREIKVS